MARIGDQTKSWLGTFFEACSGTPYPTLQKRKRLSRQILDLTQRTFFVLLLYFTLRWMDGSKPFLFFRLHDTHKLTPFALRLFFIVDDFCRNEF